MNMTLMRVNVGLETCINVWCDNLYVYSEAVDNVSGKVKKRMIVMVIFLIILDVWSYNVHPLINQWVRSTRGLPAAALTGVSQSHVSMFKNPGSANGARLSDHNLPRTAAHKRADGLMKHEAACPVCPTACDDLRALSARRPETGPASSLAL